MILHLFAQVKHLGGAAPAAARLGAAALCLTLVVLGGGLGACLGACNDTTTPSASPSPSPAVAAPAPQLPIAGAPAGAAPDFATLAAQVVPGVVSIQVEQHVKMGPGGPGAGPQDPLDFFRFFGREMPREFANRGLGSGFVIEKEGLILTNAHVVEKADSIDVTFAMADGSEKHLAAKIVGQAPDYDVALLKTEEDANATPIALGNSDAIRIGDWVMAVGNPFGLDHSVSVGIISAKERRDIAPSGRKGLYDFLQTDASINPGNSGGPLINLRGEVIGINSAVNAQGQGIGFAIPVNMVKEMLPQLKIGGRFVRSWLGIRIQPLTADLAQSYGLPTSRGVLVADVVPKGPAERAGIREGDVVLAFEGKKLNRASDLQLFASMAGVGKTVNLTVWRDKKEEKLAVKLEAFTDGEAPEAGEAPGGAEQNKTGLGIWVGDIAPAMRQRMGLPGPGGVMVENVDPGSVAHRAGLARGDVIMEVNDDGVKDAKSLIRITQKAVSGSVLRLRIAREGGRSFVALRKP